MNILVKNTQNTNTLSFYESLPLPIFLRFVFVAQAVELDYEASNRTKKICDKGTDWLLSSEAKATELFCAEAIPKEFLSGRGVLAELSGDGGEVGLFRGKVI